jgi:3-phytase
VFLLNHATGSVDVARQQRVNVREAYGICLYQDAQAQPWVILSSKDGTFVQFELSRDFLLTERRRWTTGSQPEACVADDRTGLLYVGEENVGIWRLTADPGTPADLERFAAISDGQLAADVEGLALYHDSNATYLIASSQGNNSFVVYDTGTGAHKLTFHVLGNQHIDEVSETDGLDVVSTSLPGFPGGLLVVQDGYNQPAGATQNFKLVPWSEVADLL